jgi:pseudouridylate synthase
MQTILKLPKSFKVSEEITQAVLDNRPVVALESTVITHGLPYPDNLTLARQMEEMVRLNGSIPATIAVLDGKVIIGTSADQLERLAHGDKVSKISSRDIAAITSNGGSGGTTVAGTSFIAHKSGIRVFATGGIGGVHRNSVFDISADLTQLSKTPIIVVCAGAKAILDIAATLEHLETLGIPTIGYQTTEFPAFYCISSGLKTASVAETPAEIAAMAKEHWDIGLESAILVAVPPPEDVALPNHVVEEAIDQALGDAEKQQIHGQEVTPFLLERVNQLTSGASLRVNLALLKNNARVASMVACELSSLFELDSY